MKKIILLVFVSFLFSSCEFLLDPYYYQPPAVYYRPYNYNWYGPRVYVYPHNDFRGGWHNHPNYAPIRRH